MLTHDISLTYAVKHWREIDRILKERSAPPASLGEYRATLENAPRPEDAALLIIAMRLAKQNVLIVHQGGVA